MFFESFEEKQNDKMRKLETKLIDDKSDKYAQREEKELKQIFDVKNMINWWVSFLGEDPNNLNLEKNRYPIGNRISQVPQIFESEIWQITEKKIPWFERVLPDGRKAKVESWDDTFSLDITKENSDWEQEILHIILTNFKKANESKDSTNSMPQISVNWNVKLLDNSLQYTNDIVKIVNSIEKNVMRLEREDVHWSYQKQMEKKEEETKKIDDFHVFLCELKFDPQKNNEEMLIYLTNPNTDFHKNNQDYKEIIIALCRLCGRHNSVIEVIKRLNLWEDKDQDSRQENIKTFTGEESVIEYLSSVSDSELSTIINKDKIIELSKEI